VPGRLKRLSIAAAVAVAIATAALPAAAHAGPVEDLVGKLQTTVNDTVNSVNGLLGGSGGGGSAAPAPAPAPSPSVTPQAEGGSTEPAISGTNPHAQGKVLGLEVEVIDLPGDDQVVIGQSRGEQDDNGDYHGSVVPVAVLGFEIGLVTTEEGETATSPLAPLNDILDDICTGTTVCLQALDFESSTTNTGSNNRFSAASADVANGLVSANLLESEGNINESGGCQTADGSSGTGVGLGEGTIAVDALESESHSEACNDGTESATADSEVLNLGPLDGLDPLELLGCSSTDVDDEWDVAGLVGGVCNGDDTNGTQADAPYNVRKALGLDVLGLLGTLAPDIAALATVDAATSESAAQAPGVAGPECPDPDNPACPPVDECPDPDNPDCPDGPGGPGDDECPDPDNPDCPDTTVSSGGPGGPSADTPDDDLPFTGADVGMLGAIGIGVMALGLALMAAADRRRRTANA
jgi:hypothetical protein